MIIVTALLVVLATAIGIALVRRKRKQKSNYPPGPSWLRMLRSLPSLTSDPFNTLARWGKTYGDVFMMDFGPLHLVVINSADLIREAGKKLELCGRPKIGLSDVWAGNGTGRLYGIAQTDGDGWLEQRKFVFRTLRDLGFGQKGMEDLILYEVQELMEIIKVNSGKRLAVEHLFEMPIVNAMWTLIAGHRFSYNDRHLVQQLSNDIMTITNLSSVGPAIVFPRLARMFPNLLGWNKLINDIDHIREFARSEIQKHKEDFELDNPRDFIDMYLQEIHNTTDPDSTFYKEDGELSLTVTLGDLFAAGNETCTTVLTWGCLLLATHPHVQHKLQEELDRVVGIERLPSLADREKMPYFEATMHEILRFASIIPLIPFHRVTADTEFHGHILPKDAWLTFNAYHVMRDPDHQFEKPDEFLPNRFLDKDGCFQINENFMAFGTGKRICPGEVLAKVEIFLILTGIMQKFDMKMPEDNPKPSLKYERPVLLIHPKPYQLIFSERKFHKA